MSYTRYRQAIGNSMFDAVNAYAGMTTETACPPSASVKSMQSKIDELDRNWLPTGYYKWEEMAEMVAATAKMASAASSAGIEFFSGSSTSGAKDRVRKASDEYSAIGRRALDYTATWQDARAKNVIIDAPGFKQWVIDDLRAALKLMRAIEIEVCMKPWWVGALVAFSSPFVSAVEVAKRIGKTVLVLGEAALKAVERTSGILAFIIPLLPFAALGVGGYLVYQRVKNQR